MGGDSGDGTAVLLVPARVDAVQFVMGGDSGDGTAAVSTCFVVEEPEDTEFMIDYEFPGASKTAGAKVTLTDSDEDKLLKVVTVNEKRGQITFTTQSELKHLLCVAPVGHTSGKPMVFSLQPALGHPDSYYEDLAEKEHMDRLQLEVVRLNDQLAQILSEVDYMKVREVEFHESTEAMDRNAKWWPIIQICILLFTGVMQVKHLKKFFQDKKLV